MSRRDIDPAEGEASVESAETEASSRGGVGLDQSKKRSKYFDLLGSLKTLAAVGGFAIFGFIISVLYFAFTGSKIIIEEFSAPRSFIDLGYGGKVISEKILGKSLGILNSSESARRADFPSINWSSGLRNEVGKVPFGGLSIAVAETMGVKKVISGDIALNGPSYIVTLRVNGVEFSRFATNSGDLEKIMSITSEKIISEISPYRYGVYLIRMGRHDEALSIFKKMALNSSGRERAWAYSGWSSALFDQALYSEASEKAKFALSIDDKLVLARSTLLSCEQMLGHDGYSLLEARKLVSIINTYDDSELIDGAEETIESEAAMRIHEYTGDFLAAANDARRMSSQPPLKGFTAYGPGADAQNLVAAHDLLSAELAMADERARSNSVQYAMYSISRAIELEDFSSAAQMLVELDEAAVQFGPRAEKFRQTVILPMLAINILNSGNIEKSHIVARKLSNDCHFCVLAKAMALSRRGEFSSASLKFAAAVKLGAGTPFAHFYMGEELRRRRDWDGAIDAYESARKFGPRWADPIAAIGEVYYEQGQFAKARRSFEQALVIAPSWGHLHLRLAQIDAKSDPVRSSKELARAKALPLSAADRMAIDSVAP